MNVSRVLLLVDVQNDFCDGGTLAVPDADAIIPLLNDYIELFLKKNMPVFASRDWHPASTGHFKRYGGKWPEHCVRNTSGARFHPDLRLPGTAVIVSKGMKPGEDGYSVFEAVDTYRIPFEELLLRRHIGEIVIAGLATDYCVKETVMDAIGKGFPARVCIDAVKGVDAGNSEKAINEMVMIGAVRTTLESLTREF